MIYLCKTQPTPSGMKKGFLFGLLFFLFLTRNDFVLGQCTHSIDLTDTYGDGWNGGMVTVYVNGSPVLSNITLSSGSGPVTYTFTAAAGNIVNVTRTAAGTYPSEMRIYVYSAAGTVIATTQPVASPGTNGTGACPCTPPTTQASAFTFSNLANTTMTVGWTRGNGDNVMVIARAGSAPTDPTNGTSYTANANYGSGSAVGGGYCVYNGTGTSVNLTGLAANTVYYFAIYEYATAGTCYNLTELAGSAQTANNGGSVNHPTSGSAVYYMCSGSYYDNGGPAGNYSNNIASTTVTFYPATAGNKIQITFNSFVTESATCAQNYDWLRVFNGNSTAAPPLHPTTCTPGYYTTGQPMSIPTTFTSSAADGSLTFQFKSDALTTAAGWNATIACYNPCTYPSTQASSFTSSSIGCTSMTVGWTRGNGDRVMVIAKAGSAPTDPLSGTSYTANAVYGSGSAVGGGYCVYDGTGTSVNVTGLTAGTTYYYNIYEYNTIGTCYNMVELAGSATTSGVPAAAGAISGTAAVCQGQNGVAYSVGAISGATSYVWSYSGTGFTIVSGSGTNSITANFSASATSGNLTVYGTNSCGSGAVSANYAITVNTTSSAPASASASPTTVCAGNSTTLTVSGGSLGSGASWKWYSGSCGGTLVGTGNPITVTPAVNTTYYVRAEGTCNNTSCVSTSVTIGVTAVTWTGATSTAWNTASNWSPAVVPNTSCYDVIIPATTNKPVTSTPVTVRNLTIQNGGELTSTAAITITGTFTIDNGGTYVHNNNTTPKTTIFNGIENFAPNSTFKVLNWPGISTYLHNGSTIANDPMHSTPYGNLYINWDAGPIQWEWDGYMTFASNPRIIGTLTLQALGTNDIHFSENGNESHQIGGLVINGAKIALKGHADGPIEGNSIFTVTGDVVINGGILQIEEDGELPLIGTTIKNYLIVNGNFTMNGGYFDFNGGELSGDNQGVNELWVKGNVTLNGGSIGQNNTGAGGILPWQWFVFNGAGTQAYSENGTASVEKFAYYVHPSSTVQLNSNMKNTSIGTSGSAYPMLWIEGTLDANTRQIYPNGTYPQSGIKILSGGRVKTSNPNGFYTPGGNTATVNDASSNNTIVIDPLGIVEYNGSSAQTITNGAVKTDIGGAVTPARSYGILDINNSAPGGSALTLAGNVSTDQLRLRDGVVSTGANTLTVLNTTAGASGSIQNHSMASYINTGTSGKLRRYVGAAGSYDFPVGNANTDSYQLMNIDITGGNTATYIDVNFDNPANATGSGWPMVDENYEYDGVLNNGGSNATTGHTNGGVWTVTPNTGTATYNMSLYGRNHSNQGSQRHTIVKRTFSSPSVFITDDMSSSTWNIFTNTPSVNSWITSNQSCSINGNSLMVYNTTGPSYCAYNITDNCDKIAYRTINAVGYTGLSFSFDWKCVGEGTSSSIYDYGMVGYCPGTLNPTVLANWTFFTTGGAGSGYYWGTSSTTNQNYSLPASLDNTSFYIGFRWINDGLVANGIPFIVDNLNVTGTSINPTAWAFAGTYSSSTLTTPITAVRTGLSGFSQFAIAKSNVSLPVQLLEFSGKCERKNNLLKWSTASETNNSFFTLEKSSDAQWYSVIGTVQGAGNSSTIKNYSFSDYDVSPNKTYYRLSQTDYDGKKQTFAPIAVSCNNDPSFDVQAINNAISDGIIHLSITAPEGDPIVVSITDMLGREFYKQNITSPGGNFLVSIIPDTYLAQGMYILRGSNGKLSISNKLVVK